jgi:hypothetical protein
MVLGARLEPAVSFAKKPTFRAKFRQDFREIRTCAVRERHPSWGDARPFAANDCKLRMPISKDAMLDVALAINLAQIYAWTGEKDLAIAK